jgi:Integrase core domain
MLPVISALVACVAGLFRSRASLHLEHLALRHQLAVYQRSVPRPRIRMTDRLFWSWLSRLWSGWQSALAFVQPRTVIAWQQQRFRDHWRRLSQQGPPGRPAVAQNVTEHPTAAWTAQQVVEAFPWEEAPCYLLRDRDCIYGAYFRQRVRHMGIEEVVIAPWSPWQNPYVERRIGSIRRECLNHVIVLHERHLRRLLTEYFQYYHHWRTHRALEMDCPLQRPIQRPEVGSIREVPEVGGLHHHYERRAA